MIPTPLALPLESRQIRVGLRILGEDATPLVRGDEFTHGIASAGPRPTVLIQGSRADNPERSSDGARRALDRFDLLRPGGEEGMEQRHGR